MLIQEKKKLGKKGNAAVLKSDKGNLILKKQQSKKKYIKKIFVYNIKMLDLVLDKLKAIAKIIGIKGYKTCLKRDY